MEENRIATKMVEINDHISLAAEISQIMTDMGYTAQDQYLIASLLAQMQGQSAGLSKEQITKNYAHAGEVIERVIASGAMQAEEERVDGPTKLSQGSVVQ